MTPDGWFRLRGTDFAKDPDCKPDCGKKMLHASPYLQAGRCQRRRRPRQSDVLFLSGNRAVTASVSAEDGKLKLITWDLVGVEKILRKGEIEAGAAKEVALAEVASDHVLAAVRQADDIAEDDRIPGRPDGQSAAPGRSCPQARSPSSTWSDVRRGQTGKRPPLSADRVRAISS